MYISPKDKDWFLSDIPKFCRGFPETEKRYFDCFFKLYLSNGKETGTHAFQSYFKDACERLRAYKLKKVKVSK